MARRSSTVPEPRDRPEFSNRESTNAELIAATLERFGIEPNKAHRAGKEAAFVGELAPGVGAAMAARDAKNAFSVGDIFGGALSAAGAIPGVGVARKSFGLVGHLGKLGMGLFAAKRLEQSIVTSQIAAERLGDAKTLKNIVRQGEMAAREAEQLLVDKGMTKAARKVLTRSHDDRVKFLRKFTTDQERGVTVLQGAGKKGQRKAKSADILHAPEGFGKDVAGPMVVRLRQLDVRTRELDRVIAQGRLNPREFQQAKKLQDQLIAARRNMEKDLERLGVPDEIIFPAPDEPGGF